MKIVINNNGERIPATLEVVDGVMIVSPKEEKVDITQFKDGDIITCGWDGKKKCYSWTCVLRGKIEPIDNKMFIAEYCMIDSNGVYTCENGGSDAAKWVRYATEEEKKKLFDALEKEGLTWDAEKKELVKLRWNPADHEKVYVAGFTFYGQNPFCPFEDKAYSDSMQWRAVYERGWYFKTEEECQDFCNRLNQAIDGVKP